MGEPVIAVGFLIPRHIRRAIECEAYEQETNPGDILRQIVIDHWREYVDIENRSNDEQTGVGV